MSAALPDSTLAWPICWPGVELIARAEGCMLRAYRCPAGVWTCGWGETDGVTARTSWTQAEADRRFADSLSSYADEVRAMCTREPTEHELGALVSLAYNIGLGALRGSTALRAHNAGDSQAAARAFALWNKARVGGQLTVLAGLTARRAAEAALYLRPDDELPAHRMPQAVQAESRISSSPIARSGAAAAGAGALGMLGEARDQLGVVGTALASVRTIVVDTLGVPPEALLPLVLVSVGGVAIYWRWRQRKEGWA